MWQLSLNGNRFLCRFRTQLQTSVAASIFKIITQQHVQLYRATFVWKINYDNELITPNFRLIHLARHESLLNAWLITWSWIYRWQLIRQNFLSYSLTSGDNLKGKNSPGNRVILNLINQFDKISLQWFLSLTKD